MHLNLYDESEHSVTTHLAIALVRFFDVISSTGLWSTPTLRNGSFGRVVLCQSEGFWLHLDIQFAGGSFNHHCGVN